MSPYLSLVERRSSQEPVRVMFVGASLSGVTKVFRRGDEAVEVEHSNSIREFLEKLEDEAFARSLDCVMVDQRRHDRGSELHVARLAETKKVPHLIIMTDPEFADLYHGMPGIEEVLVSPVAPQQIVQSIIAASEKNDKPRLEQPEGGCDVAPETKPPEEKPDNAFRTTVEIARNIDGRLWQKFVPLVSFLYKKMAILVLSALFLTFLFYGIMIVFFMSSSSWSLPFELSRGHELVLRAEREVGKMKVRQNQVRQALENARADLANASRSRRDAELVLSITGKTVDLEIARQKTLARETRAYIQRLKDVYSSFDKRNKKGGFGRDLNAAYKKRTITKKALDAGTLTLLEILHRMAVISNELAMKEIEGDRIANRLMFLQSLKAEMNKPEIRTIMSSGSDFVHLAREIIDAKATIARANEVLQTSSAEVRHLDNSLKVVTNNINSLLHTPAGRAIDHPITVLFVPYSNRDNYQKGSPIYGCLTAIVGCKKVGEVGDAVQGETSAVHPLFGKPLRGIFVEANIPNSKNIEEELLHVGRPPLFF